MGDAAPFNLRRACAIVFIVALALRLGLALALPSDDSVFWDQPYYEYAKHFASGEGFWMANPYGDGVGPERVYAFRPPLFPFLWGCVFKATGGAYLPIRAAHALLGALSCLVAMGIAWELSGRRRLAIVTGWLCALYPPLIWHSVHLMTEPLFIFLSLAALYALLRSRTEPGWRWLVAAGCAAGLGALSRSMLTGFLPLLALWVWWGRGWTRKGLVRAAAFTAVVSVVLSPWIVRNAMVFGAFVPSTTDAGHGAFVANNPDSLAAPEGFAYLPWSTVLDPTDDELTCQRKLLKEARGYLLRHPRTAVKLMARRFATFWRFYPNPEFLDRKKVILYACAYIPAFLLMLPGAWLLHKRYARGRLQAFVLVDLWIGYTVGIHTLLLAMMRYRVPLMPILLAFAAMSLCRLMERRKKGPAQE